MIETVLAAIITGAATLAGVLISNSRYAREMESRLERAQAVTDTKLEALTREVRMQNDLARRVPVLEEQIHSVSHRLKDVERLRS